MDTVSQFKPVNNFISRRYCHFLVDLVYLLASEDGLDLAVPAV